MFVFTEGAMTVASLVLASLACSVVLAWRLSVVSDRVALTLAVTAFFILPLPLWYLAYTLEREHSLEVILAGLEWSTVGLLTFVIVVVTTWLYALRARLERSAHGRPAGFGLRTLRRLDWINFFDFASRQLENP